VASTTNMTRREMVTGLALLGASTVLREAARFRGRRPATRRQPCIVRSGPPAGPGQLLDYFAKTAPQLLRPAEGILQHPSIAPSLPGKQYSTSLWIGTPTGRPRLFRFAKLSGDEGCTPKSGNTPLAACKTFSTISRTKAAFPSCWMWATRTRLAA